MVGIYKITNPKGKIYIGQSKHIEKRWERYSYCEYMYENNKLYNSLRCYGYSFHLFEIIEECGEDMLNDREVYWIEFYKSCCKKYPEYKGLNIELGGNKPPERKKGYKMSEESKKIISEKAKLRHAEGRYVESAKKRKRPPVAKIKKEKLLKKEKQRLSKEELSEKLSKAKNQYYSTDLGKITKEKMSKSFWNSRNKEEYKKTQSERFKGRESPMKGKKQTEKHKKALKNVQEGLKKTIIQKDMNGHFIKEWVGLVTIKKEIGLNPDVIRMVCKGKYKQHGGYKWEYKNKQI